MSDQQSLFDQDLSPADKLCGGTSQECSQQNEPPEKELQEENSGDRASRKEELIESARQLYRKHLAEATRKTYISGWNDFVSFCAEMNLAPLPADQNTVAMYMTERRGQHAPNTIEVRLSAIGFVHKQADEENPVDNAKIRKLMKGIRRDSDHVPNEAPPLLSRHIREIVDALREAQDTGEGPDTFVEKADRLRALRDVAIILVGFACALRRSELARLEVNHLTERSRGLLVTIPESKTDQEGEGQVVSIRRLEDSEYCPVLALQEWRSAASIDKGPIFRGVHCRGTILDGSICAATVGNVVERAVKAAQLPNPDRFTAHSLRAGHITQAGQGNVPDAVIKAQSRHTSDEAFQQYVRPEKKLENSSSAHLDL